jgi:peptidoglycan hydrolase-like protein with peptidoglycan-binding domain
MNEEIETEEIIAADAVSGLESDAVEAVAEALVVEPEPAPEPSPDPVPTKAQKRKNTVAVSGAQKDDVLLSRCVYKNAYSRKSLTIHHVQRVLVELGYGEASSDKDGWYGDRTKAAVLQFQKDNGLSGDGIINAETFSAIFAKDAYVNVILD